MSRIAEVPGDGIGREVVAAALRVLEPFAEHLDIRWDVFDWGADRFLADGVGLPDGAVEQLAAGYRGLHRSGRRRVTLVHKANAVPNTGRLWQQVYRAELERYPGLSGTEEYVDAFCYHLVRDASRYEGVLTENLFGDIASDVGAALAGGLGLVASASLCPETGFALFEPVHGSAPDIAGTGTANPYAAMLCVAMLLAHLGYDDAAQLLRRCLDEARYTVPTRDLDGRAGTREFTEAVTTLLGHHLADQERVAR